MKIYFHKKLDICDISPFASANVAMLLKNNTLKINFNTLFTKTTGAIGVKLYYSQKMNVFIMYPLMPAHVLCSRTAL